MIVVANIGQHFLVRPNIQIIMDGAWGSSAHVGWITWVAQLQSQRAYARRAASSLQMEALACLDALEWVQNKGNQHISLLIDSELLVRLLSRKASNDISVKWIIEDITTIVRNIFLLYSESFTPPHPSCS